MGRGESSAPKIQSHESLFGGLVIKNFPTNSENVSVIEFLIENGLPGHVSDHVDVKENGKVYVNNLENLLCLSLVKNIHHKKIGDKTLL